MNHLQQEKSPYLLQHRTNPVDWYPWGEEAFDKAGREDKPVFLSIGYSTCHWCHVMAHESFEDEAVAAALNKDFVCIKVDREERPDIDAVYMAVCQQLTGAGGWPLTVFLTPDQKPFFAGTYFPKVSRYGTIGLLELLEKVRVQWRENRHALLQAGDAITAFLNQPEHTEAREPSLALLGKAATEYARHFDPVWGGFGLAPKFPAAHTLLFLMRYARLAGDTAAREQALHTLDQMARGGIFDHIGGGFSRYSTDRKWLVPHFEKMLYDNALLVLAYGEAYRLTRRPVYAYIVRHTLDYVLRELTDERGGFYSGQDADSDGVEGKYYVFTPEEIRQELGEPEGEAFCRRFAVTETGNFEGKSIPNRIADPDWQEPWPQPHLDRLREYRRRRTSLHLDDKILTSWNALMIAALAQAGSLLDEPRYLDAARRGYPFLEENLTGEDGHLFIRWRDGQAAGKGQLEDYAFAALALLALYDTTFNAAYLQKAAALARQIPLLFQDADQGGFFLTAHDAEVLITRPKELYDGAMPSGNAVAALVFERLYQRTAELSWKEAADTQLSFLAGAIADFPFGHACSLLAMGEALQPFSKLVVVSRSEPTAALRRLRHEFPGTVVLLKTPANQAKLEKTAAFTADYPVPETGTLYYLCQNGACSSPVSDMEEIRRRLSRR